MRRLLAGAAIVVGAFWFGPCAFAAPLVFNGVSYTLESQATANPLTERFALKITGENTASDTEGGRTGINGIAFNEVSNGATASGVMLAPPTGFNFVSGGLQSSGCVANPNPNFFCFDNTAIPPTPTTLLSGPIIFVFEVTLNPGNTWAGYTTSFKIDWVGTKTGGYSLVSQPIDVGTVCPDCVINPTGVVAEPASMAVLAVGLLGLGMTRVRFNR